LSYAAMQLFLDFSISAMLAAETLHLNSDLCQDKIISYHQYQLFVLLLPVSGR